MIVPEIAIILPCNYAVKTHFLSCSSFIIDLFLYALYRALQSGSQQMKEYVEKFLLHAFRPLISILQISGHNRARQRDKWGLLLADMSNLQDEVRSAGDVEGCVRLEKITKNLSNFFQSILQSSIFSLPKSLKPVLPPYQILFY